MIVDGVQLGQMEEELHAAVKEWQATEGRSPLELACDVVALQLIKLRAGRLIDSLGWHLAMSVDCPTVDCDAVRTDPCYGVKSGQVHPARFSKAFAAVDVDPAGAAR